MSSFLHQHLEVMESTNETLWEFSSKVNLSDFHTISADFQSKGKGQDTNVWESEANKNILFSSIVFPDFVEAADTFQVSRWVSLSIVDYLKSKGIKQVKIKWPNDIYVGSKKIAGILIQNAIAGNHLSKSMFGIGLNINQEIFTSDAPNPISLVQLKPAEYEPLEELHDLITTLMKKYRLLQRRPEKLISDYHELLYQRDEFCSYKVGKGIIKAKILGVDEFGRLLLAEEGLEAIAYDLKEVKFL